MPRTAESLQEACLVLDEADSKQGSLSVTGSAYTALGWWEMGCCGVRRGGCAGKVHVALWLHAAVVRV